MPNQPAPIQIAKQVGPKDSGEIYDYVRRKEPITYRKLREDTHWMSPDDIFRCLDAMRDANLLETIDGDLDEHGTTEDLWATTREDD